MLLKQVALSSFHNRWIRTHEGDRVLLDVVTEEQCTPVNAHEENNVIQEVKMCEADSKARSQL